MMHRELYVNSEKYRQLCQWIEAQQRLVVAFSGGVDSTFLMHVATQCIGDSVTALTVVAPYIARWEIEETKALSKTYSWPHIFLEAAIDPTVANNPPDRCYQCKKIIFTNIQLKAKSLGIDVVADGSNADDLNDYRPGMKALNELGISSPLLAMGITKQEIRSWSQTLGLSTWDKPPYACLLTRLPYDTAVVPADIALIEASETYLMRLGFRAVRVRKHGDLARIEVDNLSIPHLVTEEMALNLSNHLKSLGFRYVTIDLSGYQMGSFNKTLKSNQANT